jgi:hypothetical protein
MTIEQTVDTPFLNSEKFFNKVYEFACQYKLTYIDATIKACEYFQIDPEDVCSLKLINASLKDRLHLDGMNEGYLRRESQLPI